MSPYNLRTVSRACSILREFQDDRHTLSLAEVVERTGLERTICFRLLRTLENEGFLRKAELRRYASNVHLLNGTRFRIGYAAEGHDSFCAAVGEGLRQAARDRKIDLIEFKNNYSPKAALRNVELLVKERPDLVIEFQVYERIGARLSKQFNEAGIPVIAMEIPQQGAVFFGVENNRAGQIAGKALIRAALEEWNGDFEELILLDLEIAGSVPRLRLSGALDALRKGLPGTWLTTRLDSRGEFVRSFEMTRKHLQIAPKRRSLVAGINDFSVLGALRAFEESGRGNTCRGVGFGAVSEARRELRMPGTRLVGSVGFFPERYGDHVLGLALEILQHRSVPPATYAPMQLITPHNVERFYPKEIFEQSELTES